MRLTFPSNDWSWTMSTITEKAKEEFLLILPPTAFFFVALHIVALIRSLMSKGEGIPISSTVSIAVAALILGKAVLLADMLPLINRYPDRHAGFQRRVEDPHLLDCVGSHSLRRAAHRCHA
jgi:hypothetical protein